MAGQLPVVNLYPRANYVLTYGQPKIPEKDASIAAYLDRLRNRFEQEGMQTSVYGILLVHLNNNPFVWQLEFGGDPAHRELPGGRLRPGENEIDGLKRKLCSKLGSDYPSLNIEDYWQIGECVGVWWRPNFDTLGTNLLFPQCPPEPKECKKLYLVHLPEHKRFCIPRNRNLVCSPLFELFQDMYKNEDPVICYIPDQLSRFQLNMVPENPPEGDNAGNDNDVSSDENNVAVGDN